MNQNQVYDSGSLYKLWVMAAVYQQIQAGQLDEDQSLSEDIATLNDKFNIDPEDAEQTEGTINLTVNQALTQMITISHNYAALLLTEKIRLSTVDKFLDTYGFKESKVGVNGDAPSTTSSDIALFYEKLYKGQLANPEYTQKMLDLLKAQKLNEKLPKNLPNGTIVAHKTGELGLDSHDAGIVYSSKGDYIIVVMSETKIPSAANDRIADISKNVYDYFLNH